MISEKVVDMFGLENVGSLRNIIGWTVDNKLVELAQYVSTVNEALKGKLEKLGADFDKKTKGMTPAQRNWHAQWEADEEYQLADDFPALMWQTAFIHMYFVLEHSLLNLCQIVKGANNIEGAVTGSDKGIMAAKKFLTKAGVKFPCEGKDHGPVWRDLQQMNELRNIFAHRMGHIQDKPSEELKKLINRKKGTIEIDSIGRITLKEEFCLEAIELARNFFIAVLAAVPDDKLP